MHDITDITDITDPNKLYEVARAYAHYRLLEGDGLPLTFLIPSTTLGLVGITAPDWAPSTKSRYLTMAKCMLSMELPSIYAIVSEVWISSDPEQPRPSADPHATDGLAIVVCDAQGAARHATIPLHDEGGAIVLDTPLIDAQRGAGQLANGPMTELLLPDPARPALSLAEAESTLESLLDELLAEFVHVRPTPRPAGPHGPRLH